MKRLELLLEDLTKVVEEEYDKLLLSYNTEAEELIEIVLKDLNKENTPLSTWTLFVMTISCAYDDSNPSTQRMIEELVEKMGILTEKYGL